VGDQGVKKCHQKSNHAVKNRRQMSNQVVKNHRWRRAFQKQYWMQKWKSEMKVQKWRCQMRRCVNLRWDSFFVGTVRNARESSLPTCAGEQR
jgi:hypothetical protein